MERIIAAAYKVKPEFACQKEIVGKHPSLREEFGKADILHIFGKEVDRHTDGFYTSWGRWVDRRTAAKIALACGQCKEPLIMGDRLDSSDVFDMD